MSEWKTTTIGDVLTLQRGFDITRAEQRPGSIPVVSSGGVSSYHNTAAANGPGVVIGRKGTLGKTFYLPGGYWPHDTTLWVKDFKGNNSRFIYYFFVNLDVMGLDVGSANPTLNRNHVHPLAVRWPSVPEQQRIAELLGALDDKIAVNDRITETHEQLLKARFEDLKVDVDTDSVSPGTASDLIKFNPTLPLPRDQAVYLDMAAVPTETALVKEWARRDPKSGTRFSNGDTVMARITPCLENGKTAFIDFMEDDEIGIGSTEFIVMRAQPGVPEHVPYFLARSQRFRDNAIRNMVGSSGRQRVNAAQLMDFSIAKPDTQRLAVFGEAARVSFGHMRSLSRESRDLAKLRDVLLPRLMSGEIRVRDAEKIVEDVT
jgi:type I restriction enzyme S subunit